MHCRENVKVIIVKLWRHFIQGSLPLLSTTLLIRRDSYRITGIGDPQDALTTTVADNHLHIACFPNLTIAIHEFEHAIPRFSVCAISPPLDNTSSWWLPRNRNPWEETRRLWCWPQYHLPTTTTTRLWEHLGTATNTFCQSITQTVSRRNELSYFSFIAIQFISFLTKLWRASRQSVYQVTVLSRRNSNTN